jgi:hypothetical protein
MPIEGRRRQPDRALLMRSKMMQYRLYSGPRGAEPIRAIDKDKMLFKSFTSLDEALGFAQHLDKSGQVALLIEGDDGSSFGRVEIAALLQHGHFARAGAA